MGPLRLMWPWTRQRQRMSASYGERHQVLFCSPDLCKPVVPATNEQRATQQNIRSKNGNVRHTHELRLALVAEIWLRKVRPPLHDCGLFWINRCQIDHCFSADDCCCLPSCHSYYMLNQTILRNKNNLNDITIPKINVPHNNQNFRGRLMRV